MTQDELLERYITLIHARRDARIAFLEAHAEILTIERNVMGEPLPEENLLTIAEMAQKNGTSYGKQRRILAAQANALLANG